MSPTHQDSSANRIDRLFTARKAEGGKVFIAYLTAGDPNLGATVDLVLALEKAGVDLVELGIPFSDPLADGIVNQMAAARALESGATVRGVLDAVRKIREQSQIPIILYTYLNPVCAFGVARFRETARECGVDGLLVLDLPPEELTSESEWQGLTGAGAPGVGAAANVNTNGMHLIRLIAPTTPSERLPRLVGMGAGFLYYVSQEGVTGERVGLADSLEARVAAIRAVTDLPIAIGFGISTPDQVSEAARYGDAVVVGSAIVRKIGEWGKERDLAKRLADFVKPLAAAIRS